MVFTLLYLAFIFFISPFIIISEVKKKSGQEGKSKIWVVCIMSFGTLLIFSGIFLLGYVLWNENVWLISAIVSLCISIISYIVMKRH